MRIAHITDCHIVAPGEVMADRIDSRAALELAIERVVTLDPLPDVVIATGDLVNDGRPQQYDVLTTVLGALPMDVVICAGNHDDRTELRRRFDAVPDGGPHDPIDYVLDLATNGTPTGSEVRIVVLDTTVPGDHAGALGPDQLEWLDRQLTDAADRPAIVVQHHPPFLAGIPWMDDVALVDIEAEHEVLQRHPNVGAVLCGHYHRSISLGVASAVAWCAPSSAVQIDLTAPEPTYTTEPPGLAVHDLGPDGRVRTHVVALTDAEAWRPAWSLASGA